MTKECLRRRKGGGKPPFRLRYSTVSAFILTLFLFTVLGTDLYAQESTATRGRRASNAPAAEATVTVNEQFLNSFLTAIFDNLEEPSMPLTIGGVTPGGPCASEIRLKREVGGVRTAVHFQNGHIVGPLAFSGAYSSSLLGCIQFSGWADSEVALEFSSERRALVGLWTSRVANPKIRHGLEEILRETPRRLWWWMPLRSLDRGAS